MLAVVVAEGALPIDTEGTRTVFPDEDPAVAGAGAGFWFWMAVIPLEMALKPA